jgi:hypothetical protein
MPWKRLAGDPPVAALPAAIRGVPGPGHTYLGAKVSASLTL